MMGWDGKSCRKALVEAPITGWGVQTIGEFPSTTIYSSLGDMKVALCWSTPAITVIGLEEAQDDGVKIYSDNL